MARKYIILIILVAFTLIKSSHGFAQGGGPPMLTDDPGVVDLHKWEINTSINTSVGNDVEVAIPYIDANYGVARNLQLKVETPYLVTFSHQKVSSQLGEIELGLKFKFLDQDKNFISAGTYPQLVVRGEKGLLVPLLLEKSFGKFLIGEDIGFFFGENNQNNLQIGSLLGLQASKNFQLMGEYFWQRNYPKTSGADSFINFGFRQLLTKTFTLMGSFGTQLSAASGEQKQYFISLFGFQSDF